MKMLVFEWMVGGGMLAQTDTGEDASFNGAFVDDPFFCQGLEMYLSVVEDALAAGVEVATVLDPLATQAVAGLAQLTKRSNVLATLINRFDQLRAVLIGLAQEVDQVFLIAPECDGILDDCLDWLSPFESKLINGPIEVLQTFANKNTTQRLLGTLGVPVPQGVEIDLDSRSIEVLNLLSCEFPQLLKPADGAGGEHALVCGNTQQLRNGLKQLRLADKTQLRLEQFVLGVPVSVMMLRRKGQRVDEIQFLPPTGQSFSQSLDVADLLCQGAKPRPVGHFVDSVYPLEENLVTRASRLARSLVDAVGMHEWYGCVGVDMVLGEDGDDVVVEINGRLTASYCMLKKFSDVNIVAALVGNATSRP